MPCVVLWRHHCPSHATDPHAPRVHPRPGATSFPFSHWAMPMVRQHSSSPEIFIPGPQSPEMSPNQSGSVSSPFCEDIPKASDVPLLQLRQAVFFQRTQGTQSILTNTEVIIIIGCLIPPIQHQKHNETLTLPQDTSG